MTWRDDDRTYTDWYEAAKGGWSLLNREERIAAGFVVFIVTLLVLLAGIKVGNHIGPNEQITYELGGVMTETPDRVICKTCSSSGEEWLYCKYDKHGAVLVETPEWCEVTDEHVQLDMHNGQLSGILDFKEESTGKGDAQSR